MTTQEFVKKEKEAYKPDNIQSDGHDAIVERAFGDGLTKGLEITKELIMSISGCKEQTAIKYIEDSLTEKYGK